MIHLKDLVNKYFTIHPFDGLCFKISSILKTEVCKQIGIFGRIPKSYDIHMVLEEVKCDADIEILLHKIAPEVHHLIDLDNKIEITIDNVDMFVKDIQYETIFGELAVVAVLSIKYIKTNTGFVLPV